MLTRSRFNAKFTRKLNRRKSRIELVSDFFLHFPFQKDTRKRVGDWIEERSKERMRIDHRSLTRKRMHERKKLVVRLWWIVYSQRMTRMLLSSLAFHGEMVPVERYIKPLVAPLSFFFRFADAFTRPPIIPSCSFLCPGAR